MKIYSELDLMNLRMMIHFALLSNNNIDNEMLERLFEKFLEVRRALNE